MLSDSNPKGLRTAASRRSLVSGDSQDAIVKSTTEPAVPHKTGRQRGEGSLPVGNSKSKNVTITNHPIPRAEPRSPQPCSQRTRVGDQRVGAVFQRELSHWPNDGSSEKGPADCVLGAVRGDQSADRREGEDQYREEYLVPQGG